MNPPGRREHHRACTVCDDHTSAHTVHHNAPTRPPPRARNSPTWSRETDSWPIGGLAVALVLVGYPWQKTLPACG
ncbi:hypothetical protein [Streptomyces sp. NPDC056291]|uniref:hypothetical protein n=1 Tax=Streptomyces sp. NPDC056291 TaxID=3345772 RepID=UPI0035DDD2E7